MGLYWGIRGAAICWAPLMGALVWWWLGPDSLLYLAFGFGCAGAAIFYGWVGHSDRAPATSVAEVQGTLDA